MVNYRLVDDCGPQSYFKTIYGNPFFTLDNHTIYQKKMSMVSRPRKRGLEASYSKVYKKKTERRNYRPLISRLLPESKEVITAAATVLYGGTTANGVTVALLNGIAEGLDYNNRIGRKIRAKYVDCSISVETGNNGDYGFWAIVLDRQPTGSVPAFTDIFDTAGTDVGLAPKNTNIYQDRFLLLAREEFAIGINTQCPPYHVKRYVSMSKLQGRDATCNFSSSAATIAAINNGAVYIVAAAGDNSSAALTGTTFKFTTKYRFTDV